MGHARFQVDGCEEFPLDIAVDVGVEALLKDDCQELFALNTKGNATTLPRKFLRVARSDNTRLHEIIIDCLSRHKFLLPRLLPYHDLRA
jgi:hypothetical protein